MRTLTEAGRNDNVRFPLDVSLKFDQVHLNSSV